jgi:hypothetical protein
MTWRALVANLLEMWRRRWRIRYMRVRLRLWRI